MKKTLSVNISGINFHIDEDAYEKLRRYLEAIRSHFQGINGRDEVMADIELRIAELLNQKISETRHVITLEDVDEVIRIMGQPSDFAPEEEFAEPGDYSRYQKRLYRDPEHKVIGGVCGGIGAYFNLDPVWIRLIFILLVFASGFGILLYVILWLAVPEARTAAERLEMRGQPVNVSTLEASIRQEMGGLKEKVSEMADKARDTYTKKKDDLQRQDYSYIHDNLRSVGHFFLRVFGILAGAVIFLLAASLSVLFLFIVLRVPGITVAEQMEFGFLPVFPFLSMLFENDADLRTVGVGLLILVAIPLLLLMLAGIRLIFRIPSMRFINGAAGWIWLLTFIITLIFSIKVISSFRSEEEVVREQALGISRSDTLRLVVASSLPSGTRWEYQESYNIPEWDLYLAGFNDTLYGIPRLNITLSDDSMVYIGEKYYSRGRTRVEAGETAEAILYSWSIKGDSLLLPESFSILPGQPWRKQELLIDLKLPEGLVFSTDGKVSGIAHRIKGISKHKMDNNLLIMTENGVHKFVP